MVRMICLLMFSMAISFVAHAEMGGDYCSNEAWKIASAAGGDQVQMTYSSVSGFYVNAFGYANYTFMRGNEQCSISFTVKGTYFGTLCSEDFGGVSCSGDRARARRHRR